MSDPIDLVQEALNKLRGRPWKKPRLVREGGLVLLYDGPALRIAMTDEQFEALRKMDTTPPQEGGA